mmetsp:Transcript_23649/g.29078  ORF Transcript_23649/g.29078 Transcript_23649/m.29078 type:complete len:581 (+) Transcript_23649:594-2336(+)
MGSVEHSMNSYPQRVGEADCRDFLRTGRCKYGESCKYHHPLGGTKTNDPNEPPFPMRPNEPPCQYYLKNATCKFGQTCRFHHPPNILTKGGSALSGTALLTISNTPLVPKLSRTLDTSDDISNVKDTLSNQNHLPERPGEPDCIFYLRNGRCKYGATCKYHHPRYVSNALQESSFTNDRVQHVPANASIYDRDRPCITAAMTDGPKVSSVIASGLSPTQKPNVAANPHESLRQIRSNGHLDTIDNPYQQFSHGALDMLNNSVGGTYYGQAYSTPPANNSPKMGSPCMSSTTVASSYDTVASGLEVLPPSRIQAQHCSGMVMSSQGMQHMPLGSFSERPHPSSHQMNNGQYVFRTNSTDDISLSQQLCNPITPMADMSRINHPRINHPRSYSHDYVQQPYGNGRSSMNQSFSSNTSIASMSPTGSSNAQQREDYWKGEPIGPAKKQIRSVDDGLSLMTDALLTMLDTQDEGTHDNRNLVMKNNYVSHPPQNISGFSSNSLPDYLLTGASSSQARDPNGPNILSHQGTIMSSDANKLGILSSQHSEFSSDNRTFPSDNNPRDMRQLIFNGENRRKSVDRFTV